MAGLPATDYALQVGDIPVSRGVAASIPGEGPSMDWMTWYNGLAKPSWTPSPPTIGLIRQILCP